MVFHDTNLVYFGWNRVNEQSKCKEKRLADGSCQITGLSMSVVRPDSWNKMRVSHAKAIFSRKTITKDIAFYSEMLNCLTEVNNLQLTGKDLSLGMALLINRHVTWKRGFISWKMYL